MVHGSLQGEKLHACVLALYKTHSMAISVLCLFASHGPDPLSKEVMTFNSGILCMPQSARVAHGCIAGGGVMYLLVASCLCRVHSTDAIYMWQFQYYKV